MQKTQNDVSIDAIASGFRSGFGEMASISFCWENDTACGFQSGFSEMAGISSRGGHVRAFTYNYVKTRPEYPAPHDLLSSGSNKVCFATTPPDMEASCIKKQQNGYDSRYTFSAKEKDDETQYSYFGARYYDSDLSVWLSVDPMAAKYPSMSPYMYCAGNPVIYKDPDGRDIVIWYIDENSGLLQKFTFNGQNAANAPDNIFVQSFLSAYNYNIGNGGGEFMQYAANDHDNNYNVVDAKYSKYATKSTMFVPNYYKDEYEILFWDPNMGSLHSDNKITSPASDAEHEFRHYVDYIRLSLGKYYELRETPDYVYKNALEALACIAQSKTAVANMEVPQGWSRPGYGGVIPVKTTGPTSNRVDFQRAYQYFDYLEKKGYDLSRERKILQNYESSFSD